MQPEQPTPTLTIPPKQSHKHTLIWLHGLSETPQKHAHIFSNPLFDNIKIIAPQAPHRYVTIAKYSCTSWFDVKFRGDNSFVVDFDQAFSKSEVIDSFDRVIAPIVTAARFELEEVAPGGRIIVAGFSQGCGMSLHTFYSMINQVDAVIGISGYLFPFTPVQPTQKFKKILHGKSDRLRPWQQVQTTYMNKINQQNITLVDKTGHEVNEAMMHAFHNLVREFLGL